MDTTPENRSKNLEAFQALLEIDEKERHAKTRSGYLKAYGLSLFLPPLGIYYFFKYLFFADGTKDDVRAGVTALVLTVLSGLASIGISIALFRQTPTPIPTMNEIQEIKRLYE